MAITLSSFFASSIALTILVGILFLILKKHALMSRFGIGCIYLFVLLIILRGFIPVDFYEIHLTTSIYSESLFSVRTFFLTNLFFIGSFPVTLLTLLCFVWFAGFFVYLFRKVTGYIKLSKMIETLPEITDSTIQKVFKNAWKSLYLTKESPLKKVVSSNLLSSPAIFGIRNPVILLPDIPYNSNELYYVFLHECIHYKHKDFFFKVLLDILIAIHWWNPLISHFLFPAVNQIQELLVDYHLANHLSRKQKAEYMITLTKTMRYNQTKKTPSFTYTLTDSHNNSSIQQRLQYIMNHSVKQIPFWGIVFCIILFILSFTFVFEPITSPETDKAGNIVWRADEENSFYIRNGDKYDLFIRNEYVITTDQPCELFKDFPIYSEENHP